MTTVSNVTVVEKRGDRQGLGGGGRKRMRKIVRVSAGQSAVNNVSETSRLLRGTIETMHDR